MFVAIVGLSVSKTIDRSKSLMTKESPRLYIMEVRLPAAPENVRARDAGTNCMIILR